MTVTKQEDLQNQVTNGINNVNTLLFTTHS